MSLLKSYKKIYRLLDWADRDKCILISFASAALFGCYILWFLVAQSLTDFASEFLVPGMVRIAVLQNLVIMGLWSAIGVLGLWLRKNDRRPQVYTSLFIYFYGFAYLPIGHLVGFYTPLTGVVALGAALTGLILFDFRRVILSLSMAMLCIAVLAGLSASGVIEYAPMLVKDPVGKQQISMFWVASLFLCAIPFVAMSFALVILVLVRWRVREARILLLSATDALTGLANRRALFEQVEHEISRARRTGEVLSLCVLDLDNFKTINDVHGHAAGDQVLVDVAERLRGSVRDMDLVGRIGGEEFVLLLPSTEPDVALRAVERCRRLIEAEPVRLDNGETLAVTASFGLVSGQADERLGLSQLIARADEALYAAKREGRNRVKLWQGERWPQDGVPRPE